MNTPHGVGRKAGHLDLGDLNRLYAPAAYFDGYVPRGWPDADAEPDPEPLTDDDDACRPGLTAFLAGVVGIVVFGAVVFLGFAVIFGALRLAWEGAAWLFGAARGMFA